MPAKILNQCLTLIKIALSLGFGYFLYFIYQDYFVKPFYESAKTSKEEIPNSQISTIQLEAFNKDGQKICEVFGRNGVIDEQKKTVLLKPITLILYVKGKQDMILIADVGLRFQTNPEYFELAGKVEGTGADGRKIFAGKLIYYPQLEKIVSPGKFKLIERQNIVQGDYFEYYQREDRGEIRGNVQMKMNETVAAVIAEKEMGLDYE